MVQIRGAEHVIAYARMKSLGHLHKLHCVILYAKPVHVAAEVEEHSLAKKASFWLCYIEVCFMTEAIVCFA